MSTVLIILFFWFLLDYIWKQGHKAGVLEGRNDIMEEAFDPHSVSPYVSPSTSPRTEREDASTPTFTYKYW